MPLPIITSLYYNNFVNIQWYLGYFRDIKSHIGILGCRMMIRVWTWICRRTAPSLQTPCLTAFREWRIRRPWNNQKSVSNNPRAAQDILALNHCLSQKTWVVVGESIPSLVSATTSSAPAVNFHGRDLGEAEATLAVRTECRGPRPPRRGL